MIDYLKEFLDHKYMIYVEEFSEEKLRSLQQIIGLKWRSRDDLWDKKAHPGEPLYIIFGKYDAGVSYATERFLRDDPIWAKEYDDLGRISLEYFLALYEKYLPININENDYMSLFEDD